MTWLRPLLILFAAAFAVAAHAQTFPPLTGRVVDAANVLPPEVETALTAKLATLEAETTRQFVIATIPSLEDYDIAEYGYKLGDAWKIGQRGEKNGLILIVAPNERKVRFEVASGLGDILPDVLASRIIRNEIVPRFKAGDLPGGVVAGTDAAIALIRLPPGEAAKQARQMTRQPQSQGVDIGTILFFLAIFFFFVLPLLRSIFGKRRGRRFGSAPVVIWGPGDWGGGSSGGFGGGDFGGGGFSGGGGSFDGGGASGDW
jgi:uncharacterized protein